MVYQGSKNRFAKYICPILQKCIDENSADTYIELFGGGANVINKIKCPRRIYSDINSELVSLFNYAKTDINLSIAPEDCSKEHYDEVRGDREHKKFPPYYRALIGYMASYGGRYFDGGYGRDSSGGRSIYRERLNNFKRQIPDLLDIQFFNKSYNEFNPNDFTNCVFYLDPPYKDTKQYANQSIDYDEFYKFVIDLSEHNYVFISEYHMPEDNFTCVWEMPTKTLLKSDRETGDVRTEKLFVPNHQVLKNNKMPLW